MEGIFISYRREESAGHAGRVYDRLREKFGKDKVFMDVSAIEPGVDFVEIIDKEVGSCAVLLVIIGRRWLECANAAGRRRLDDPKDFIRLEVGTALRRTIRVIPVLVQNADMPGEEDLPEDLKLLARRNAIEINDNHWDSDLNQLVETLERIVAGGTDSAAAGSAVKRDEGAKKNRLTWLISSITAVILTLAGLFTGIDSFRDAFVKPFKGGATVTATNGKTPAVTTPVPSSQVSTTLSTVTTPVVPTPQPQRTPPRSTEMVVPNVVGQTLEKARKILKKQGFGAEVAGENGSSDVPAGTVLRQFPKAGDKLDRGGRVGLVLASRPNEPKLVTVPNVLRLPLDRAVSMLSEAGLQPGAESPRALKDVRPGTIVNQKVKPGSLVERGTKVDLWVAVQPTAETPPVGQSRKVLAKGNLDVRQTYLFDLDTGKIMQSGESDILFEAATATERFLTPRNGASIGLVRGAGDFDSCSRARMSERRILVEKLPVSIAICVRTNRGHLASFRLREPIGPSPGVLKISYIVWE